MLCFVQKGIGQSHIANQQHMWLNLSERYYVSPNVSLTGLYSIRRNDYMANWQQSVARLNVNYQLKDAFTATIGYDFVTNYPYGKQPLDTKFYEHRIVEQFTLKSAVGKWECKHRYRLEHRFMRIPDEPIIRNRARYQLVCSAPISIKQKVTPFSFVAFNEVFINLHRASPAHIFDQNWLYGGFNYKWKYNLSFDVGYMNQYLLKPGGVMAENNHTIMLGIKHKIELSEQP